MENLNQSLFLWLNASADASHAGVLLATILAEQAIWLVPIVLTISWLRGSEQIRKLMIEATAAGLTALLLNQLIGLVWYHPRPFEIGLGHTLIAHVVDSSFPSDHLALLWAVGFSFLLHARLRRVGALLALLGLPMAWARIYLGVHFPLDVMGAAMVAGLSAWLCFRQERRFVEPTFHWATAIHRRLFAPLIRRGWVRQ